MPTTTMGVKIEKAVQRRLKHLGASLDRSPHWLVKRAIEEFLEKEERWEREKKEDRERWSRYVETGSSVSRAELTMWIRERRARK